MADRLLIVQRGHVGRTSGATGTAGEQAMAKAVSAEIVRLTPPGWTVRLIDADEPDASYRGGHTFVAIHGDGNANPSVAGASVGYRNPEGKAVATAWKAAYKAAGFPGAWHADNYTANLGGYYGVREAVSNGTTRAFVLEVGTMTNPKERAWIDAHHTDIARSVWTAVAGTEETVAHWMISLHPRIAERDAMLALCKRDQFAAVPYSLLVAVHVKDERMAAYREDRNAALGMAVLKLSAGAHTDRDVAENVKSLEPVFAPKVTDTSAGLRTVIAAAVKQLRIIVEALEKALG